MWYVVSRVTDQLSVDFQYANLILTGVTSGESLFSPILTGVRGLQKLAYRVCGHPLFKI